MIKKLVLGLILGFLVSYCSAVEYTTWEGSGFLINQMGEIATAAHVVDQKGVIIVEYQNKWYKAEVIAKDEENDLAIIRTKIRNDFAFEVNPREFRGNAFVIGFPATTDRLTITVGALGKIGGFTSLSNTSKYVVCGGNSGGPLVTVSGKVIGVVTRSITERKDECGYTALAIHSQYLRELAYKNNILLISSFSSYLDKAPDVLKKIIESNGVVRILIVPKAMVHEK